MQEHDLICLICGNEEGPPFDIGDECTCGGLFVLKESGEDKSPRNPPQSRQQFPPVEAGRGMVVLGKPI
jgi:hypothetical protein